MNARLKKILGITLAQVLLLVVVVVSTLGFLRDSNEDQLQKHINLTATLFNNSVKDAVLSTDIATLESFIEESVSSPDIAYMRIVSNKVILAEGGDMTLFSQLHRPYRSDTVPAGVTDGIYDIHTEIIEDGVTYGTLEIGISISSLENMSLKARRWILGLLALLIIVISSWAYLLRKAKNKLELENEANMEQLVSQSRHVVMGEMIAMLTHQWKQPLTSMIMNVGAVKIKLKTMKMTDDDEQFLKTRIEKIEGMVDNQNQLLSDFRDFFHPEKEKKLFNLKVNIDSVLDMLQGLIVEHNIAIKTNVPPKLEVLGYDREMRHVMINLIKNAIDQMVMTSVKDPTIWISASMNEDKRLNITVEDNGGGIDESIIKTIFEPYMSTKSLNGTGLGLYMCKKIIEDNCKGNIRVVNTKQGAKFIISIT